MNMKIISKQHAYLQSIIMTSVKFQKNRNKTVVTKELCTQGTYSYRGQKDRHRVGQKDGKPKTHNVPQLFFEKAGDNKTVGEVSNAHSLSLSKCLKNN